MHLFLDDTSVIANCQTEITKTIENRTKVQVIMSLKSYYNN